MVRKKGEIPESRKAYDRRFVGVFQKYAGRLKTARGCLEVMRELALQGPGVLSSPEWDTIDRRFHQRAENLTLEKYEAKYSKQL